MYDVLESMNCVTQMIDDTVLMKGRVITLTNLVTLKVLIQFQSCDRVRVMDDVSKNGCNSFISDVLKK